MQLVFDLDNTLIDRDFAFRKSLELMFAKHNHPLNSDDLRKIWAIDNSGKNDRDYLCTYLEAKFPNLGMNRHEIWKQFSNIPDFVKPDLRVHSFLIELAKHFSISLLSNGSGNMQRRKIKNAGLQDLFSDVYISGELGIEKPNLKLFKFVLEDATVEPGSSVMIGDDLEKDIVPARMLGMNTILLDKDLDKRSGKHSSESGAKHYSVNSLESVREAIFECVT